MNNKIVILGKGSVRGSSIPESVKVWESKFEREIGDRIKYENEEWRVISVGFESMDEARACKDAKVQIYKENGYWEGSVSRRSKF